VSAHGEVIGDFLVLVAFGQIFKSQVRAGLTDQWDRGLLFSWNDRMTLRAIFAGHWRTTM
jgi:hypothetical protein